MGRPKELSQVELAAHPRMVRRQAILWSIVLPGAALLGWFMLPASIRVLFTGLQIGTLVFFVLIMLGIVWVMAMCWVKAGPEGVVLRNGLKRYHVPWDAVAAVRYWPGDSWAFLEKGHLDQPVLALQRVDGRYTDEDVEVLRELHARYAPVRPASDVAVPGAEGGEG
ncbi:PH domain-containing protein [Propioniciclava soli]|uniref:PH domain-containing protein n=1 Tax=Propioniciclava soli TaxID=2775081 RepID=UPI001E36F53D|nr:PH domain-containing protein [Propioniciclava soli]